MMPKTMLTTYYDFNTGTLYKARMLYEYDEDEDTTAFKDCDESSYWQCDLPDVYELAGDVGHWGC